MVSAEEVAKAFEADAPSRRRLAEFLAAEPDIRLALINVITRDVSHQGLR